MREGLDLPIAPTTAGHGSPPNVVPAPQARLDDLMELTHELRADLVARGEFLPTSWVEESATELKSGRLPGWVIGGPTIGGLAFLSPRSARAYGHAHIREGPGRFERAQALLAVLRAAAAAGAVRVDAGVTGLSGEEEERLRATASSLPGERVLFRHCLELPVPAQPASPTAFPLGWTQFGVREVHLDALAELDWSSFQDTPDASLVADTPGEDQRVLQEILDGRLGRFLDEASTVLLDPEGRAAAFLMTSEQDPRRAIFLDLVVRADVRRRRVGRTLLEWGARALSGLGHGTVRLWVSESNRPARALYDSIGFRPTSRAVIYRFSAGAPQPQ